MSPKPLQRLSLVSFLDIVDRTDLLFHEIRQLQTTLIQQIGLPELLDVLRFEEPFLWGDNDPDGRADAMGGTIGWLSALNDARDDIRTTSRDLAKRWTIRYPFPFGPYKDDPGAPPPDGCSKTVKTSKEKRQGIYCRIVDTIRNAAHNGYLTQDLRRIYFMIAELQVVKQNLLREKIIAVHVAFEAFSLIRPRHRPVIPRLPKVSGIRGEDLSQPDVARLRPLLVTCWIVRTQLGLRVERVGNIQRQIEQIMDVSLEIDPRPSVARRRDQGIYTDAIVDRAIRLQERMNAILDRLGAKDRFAPGNTGTAVTSKHPAVVMHRWDLQHTSRWQHEIDAIYLDQAWNPQAPPLDPNRYNTLRYVNSSYWMPDRPDMQPHIAHEIAHAELAQRYFGPSLFHLAGAGDKFATLMNRFNAAVEDYDVAANAYGVKHYWTFTYDQRRVMLTEVAADLLATAAIGEAYLFAMALDLPGLGFEMTLDGLPGIPDFDLNIEDEIFERLSEVYHPPSWFLRLHIVIGFLHAMADARDSRRITPLARTLSDGVRDSARLFYSAFRDGTKDDWTGAWDHWHAFCLTAERIAAREDGAVMARALAGQTEAEVVLGSNPDQAWQQISKIVRGPLLERVTAPPHLLNTVFARSEGIDPDRARQALRSDRDIERKFAAYLDDPSGTSIEDLFRWVFDVPWQSAMISSQDLFPIPRGEVYHTDGETLGPVASFLATIHREHWLGRDIFQLGLELWYWRTRKVRSRLEACARAVEALIADWPLLSGNWFNGLLDELKKWLQGPPDTQGASSLLRQSPHNWSADPDSQQYIERKQVEKISSLGRLLHDSIEAPKIRLQGEQEETRTQSAERTSLRTLRLRRLV